MAAYPVFLTNMDERRAVVVGAAPPVERKVQGLLEADARVTLVAPSAPAPLREQARAGRIDWLDRAYRAGDLRGAVLAIVTSADETTAERVWTEAQERNVLVNTAGDEARSTFTNGACLRRGPLLAAVSTTGAAPALSVRLRDELSEAVGPEYETLVRWMKALRSPLQAHVADFSDRRDRWYALLDSDVLRLLREEQVQDAWAEVESIVGTKVVENVDTGTLPGIADRGEFM